MKVWTEEEFANSEIKLGENVVKSQGTYWKEIRGKFFMPLHPIREFESFARPSLKTPFRLYVSKEKINTHYTVMELSNPADFKLDSLSANTRSKVRRGSKRVEVEEISYSNDLSRQAFEIYTSFYSRTRWGNKSKLNIDNFDKWFRNLFVDERFTLGGLIKDRLAGFLRGHIIVDTAYLSFIATHADSLNSYPNEALVWSFIERVQQLSEVKRIIYATKSKKDSLNTFKSRMGFLEKSYPARFDSIIPVFSNICAKYITKRF